MIDIDMNVPEPMVLQSKSSTDFRVFLHNSNYMG